MDCCNAFLLQQWTASALPADCIHIYSTSQRPVEYATRLVQDQMHTRRRDPPVSSSSLFVTSSELSSTLVRACSWLLRMRTILLRGSVVSPWPLPDLELTFSMQAFSSMVMFPNSALIFSARAYRLSRSVSSSFIICFSSCSAN